MSGVRLLELEAGDMLDVVHFIFEEDNRYTTGEEAHAHSKMRTSMYKDLYNVDYKYMIDAPASDSNATSGIDSELEEADEISAPIEPFNPRAKSVIPFTPATTFNPELAKPFGDVLDTPLG